MPLPSDPVWKRDYLYPDAPDAEWLEFDSMINLRPSFGNRSRGIDDPGTQAAVAALVSRLVRR